MNPEEFLKGIYNITPTPFQPDGSLDEASLATLTEYNIAQGVNGMTILGVMGETAKVTDAERDVVISKVLEAANGRVRICVGATHGGTDGCVARARRAQELGADALMIAPPLLGRSNDAALRRHYHAVADAVDLPIVVQDHPPSANVHMSVDFIAKIAQEVPQCRFLKAEDEPTPAKIGRVLAANPAIRVFGGLGAMMFLEELKRGAVGAMTGFGFPHLLVDIYCKFSAGDLDGATESFYRICPLIRFEAQQGLSLTVRKHIYAMRGAMASAQPRAPYPELDDGTRRDLEDLLARLGLG